jgi:hypothetical protein
MTSRMSNEEYWKNYRRRERLNQFTKKFKFELKMMFLLINN